MENPIVAVVTGTLFANLITFALIYGVWRLTKNDRDVVAMGICLICFGLTALFALGSQS